MTRQLSNALSAAESGKRVAIMSHTRTRGRLAFDALAEEARAHPTAAIRRAKGIEGISYPNGGSVRLHTIDSLRGYALDAVYVTDEEMLVSEFTAAVMPSLMTSDDRTIEVLTGWYV